MDSAVIAYVHPDYVRSEFMASMLALQHRSATPIEAIIEKHSGPLIASARNDLVSMFLTERRSPWLWMVDTDMVFAPDTLDRLIAAADPRQRPIMGGLCYMKVDESTVRPTMFEMVPDENNPAGFAYAWYDAWPEDQPFQVGATGAACLLVHRDALARIAAGFGEHVDRVWPWFRESSNGNRRLGEDLTFCLRAGLAGLPVHVHTGVQLGHMKSTMLGKVI
jgi:hypothetical protein